MKKIFHLFLAIIATGFIFSFSSCEEDEIETIPLQTVNGEIFELVDFGAKFFVFEFRTDLETYPVTYAIRNQSSVENNEIIIELLDIQKEDFDDINISEGSATCTIDLGALSKGQYNLQISAGNNSGTGTISVLDDLVAIDFDGTDAITITNDTLHRIPFGTVWGYVGYNNSSFTSIANGFISDMNSLGTQPPQLPGGYYGLFSVSDSGNIIQPIGDYNYYKEFFKHYTGDPNELDELVSNYVALYHSRVDLIFNWFWDGENKSQMLYLPNEE